jgi:hypothetical protein
MIVSYKVYYEGDIEIDDSEWDEQTQEVYRNDLESFVFSYVQDEIMAWQGLTITSISGKPK